MEGKKVKNAWLKYDEKDLKEVNEFSKRYKDFITNCKTERECTTSIISVAEKNGYVDLNETLKENKRIKSGDKLYINNMGKAVALFVIGEEPLTSGMNIIGSHLDSPRSDLKQNPLYEEGDFALFKTHYYGGIKKYQWVTTPLAIHGVVVQKNGEKINVVIGENEDDPVFCFTDLLAHLSSTQMKKKASEVIEGENLNLLAGSIPCEVEKDKYSVKDKVLNIIREKYGIDEEDFISSEFEVVPAGPSRDLGIDSSMIIGYGHDDRVCAYTSFEAIIDMQDHKKTLVNLMVDKEEIGSVGATSMGSAFFENAVAEIINNMEDYNDIKLRRAFSNSKMLSADVNAAFDPTFPDVFEKANSAYFGKGVIFTKYTGVGGKAGSNDANAEFIAEIRRIMDENNISFQTAELGKVDQGGGGTIAYILAALNMQVLDAGVPVLSMHSPCEVISKVDLFETYKAFKAFYQEA